MRQRHSNKQRWVAVVFLALVASSLAVAPAARGEPAQDLRLQFDRPGLAHATFHTTYDGMAARVLRQAADSMGVQDGTVSESEATNMSLRAQSDLEGKPTSRVFLDGTPGSQIMVQINAIGLVGSVDRTDSIALDTQELVVLPEANDGTHWLLVVPSQNGVLTLQPPAGWAASSSGSVSLTRGMPLSIAMTSMEVATPAPGAAVPRNLSTGGMGAGGLGGGEAGDAGSAPAAAPPAPASGSAGGNATTTATGLPAARLVPGLEPGLLGVALAAGAAVLALSRRRRA